MSMEAFSWVFNLDLPSPATKLILIALANSTDEDGFASLRQARLSKITGMTTRSIRTHLAILEELKILTKIPQTGVDGSTLANLFKLNIPPAKGSTNFSGGEENIHTPVSVLDTPIRHESTRVEKESYLLPEYISQEAWDGFVEMRMMVRKPLTPLATERIIKSLVELRANGEDVNAVLDQSTINNWMGVFPVK